MKWDVPPSTPPTYKAKPLVGGARNVVWFSCGVSSAVAAKLAVDNLENVHVAYCDTSIDEHPDNLRFLKDVEEWIGQSIDRISSDTYESVNDVIDVRRYMSGRMGAPCTVELKKVPRFGYQRPDDVHIFGFTWEELPRVERFEANNPELLVHHILMEYRHTKDECMSIVRDAGIEIPALYKLGYRNNNCIGCVKATSAKYWNMVRRDFPEIFQLRTEQSLRLGVKLVRTGDLRLSLDELPVETDDELEDISCGPDCDVSMW